METELRRGPGRPPKMQTTLGESLERATPGYRDPKERARAIREAGIYDNPSENKYDIVADLIPDGWDYMWVRCSTMGREDGAFGYDNVKARMATGWEPVPRLRHPDLSPDTSTDYIVIGGQMLMERPMEISQEMDMRTKRDALAVMQGKEAELGLAGEPGAPRVRPNISTSVEPISVPE